jgi:D-arginine dehydrogenase
MYCLRAKRKLCQEVDQRVGRWRQNSAAFSGNAPMDLQHRFIRDLAQASGSDITGNIEAVRQPDEIGGQNRLAQDRNGIAFQGEERLVTTIRAKGSRHLVADGGRHPDRCKPVLQEFFWTRARSGKGRMAGPAEHSTREDPDLGYVDLSVRVDLPRIADKEIEFLTFQHLGKIYRRLVNRFDADARAPGHPFGDGRTAKTVGIGRHQSDPQMTGIAAFQKLKLVRHVLGFEQHLPRTLQQRFAHGRQDHGMFRAIEELDFHRLFQCLYRMGQGWLGQVGTLGGAAKVAFLGDQNKMVQLTQIHDGRSFGCASPAHGGRHASFLSLATRRLAMRNEPLFDIAVIGAGIAGASVAAELAAEARVLLLEMERHPGYHTTGRSAAVFAPIYGPPPIRALTRASEAFFLNPPVGFAEHPLLLPRGAMMVARADQIDRLEAAYSEVRDEGEIVLLDAAGVRERQPLLREDYAAGGFLDAACTDIDVHALHQGYLRQLKARGGVLQTHAEVTALARGGGAWKIETKGGTFGAPLIVNAAGAWADLVGQMAGAERIGLVPKRRTALIVDAPDGAVIDDWPVVIDIDEEFYLKPDAGRLLISPANEDPDVPSDVQPDELDIAICIDRVERAFDLKVRRIENRWAGLRSFVADKCPVAGFSGQAEGFFWLAGQGGYGIQTAPALSHYAAAEVLGQPVPADVLACGLDRSRISPERLRHRNR